jgi:CubicO group peptidase (beta-lactamase class C family)
MKRPLAVLSLALLLAAGCADDPTGPGGSATIVDLAQPWGSSTPSEEGIDPIGLAEAAEAAADLGFVRALLVVRNGRLVEESYFDNTNQSTVLDVHSVTKTVTALLVGMAVDDGALDVDDFMVDWLPPDGVRPEHESIRLHHLLTMTSGIEWSDEEDFRPWLGSGRPIGYVLDQPVVAPPGEQFIYATGGSHLLSAIVAQATGGDALSFAEERLLEPLGITEGYWLTIGGQPIGGAGLGLRARDMARLGQLVLQRGRSGERRLVSEGWIDEAFTQRVNLSEFDGFLDRTGYGYQVWTDDGSPRSRIMIGFGGQLVWMVPDLDLVVVVASRWSISEIDESGAQTEAVIRLVRELLLPAVDGS